MSYFDRSTEALTPSASASLLDELINTIETGNTTEPVSYTHLTLPTIYSV